MPGNTPAPPTEELSRRQLLERGTASSLALATVTASGCLDRLSTLGRVGPEELDVPPADPPEYGDWLPAPSALPDNLGLDPSHLLHATPSETQRSGLGAFFAFPDLLLPSRLDWFGRGYDQYDRALMVDDAVVLEGTITRSAVESTMADTGYEPAGTYEGYDLYDRSDQRRTVAVGDDALVFASDEHGERYVKTLIDAADGRVDRYHETDEGFARLLEETGTRPSNWFTPDENFVQSISGTYDDEYVYHVYHRLYPDDASVSESELRSEFEGTGDDLGLRATTIDSDGRFTTVVLQFDRGVYPNADSAHEWPQITWGIDHDEETAEATLRHEAGDAVEADHLSVEYGPDDPADEQFADEYDTVEPGDGLVLDLSARDDERQVMVICRPGEHASARLFNYRIDR